VEVGVNGMQCSSADAFRSLRPPFPFAISASSPQQRQRQQNRFTSTSVSEPVREQEQSGLFRTFKLACFEVRQDLTISLVALRYSMSHIEDNLLVSLEKTDWPAGRTTLL